MNTKKINWKHFRVRKFTYADGQESWRGQVYKGIFKGWCNLDSSGDVCDTSYGSCKTQDDARERIKTYIKKRMKDMVVEKETLFVTKADLI